MPKRKFVAIQDFKDLLDKDKIYYKGDRYPKPVNKIVSDERLEQLLTHTNKQGRPVIEEVKEEQA